MELLRAYAMALVGIQYKWGGDDPLAGFDCSGLAQELLASMGIDPPGDQTAQALHDHFKLVGAVSKPQCGALAFYGKGVRGINHVAMCLDEYRVIEAGGGGSKTTTLEAATIQNAYVRMRPLHHRLDLVAVLMPQYRST